CKEVVGNYKRWVNRIDEIGRAEALAYQNFQYKPQEREVKYFLSQFCLLHYSRNRLTLKDTFSRSLYFLDGRLANTILDSMKKSKLMESYMSDPNLPDVEVEIKNVVLEEIQNPPYKAKVDVNKLFLSRSDRTILKQELSTISFVYSFRERIENQLIPINPLGLIITYFREDQAFR